MKRILFTSLFLFFSAAAFSAMVELKNIVSVEGLQDNPLLGYGIVVGLKGTGDSENGSQTREILSRIANNFGIKISADRLKPKNSTIVLVSGTISPFARPGARMDVKVSSVFDARSLEGGELVLTPLIAGDNEIYAVASGGLMSDRSSKGVMGFIPQGAIIQRPVESQVINSNNEIALNVQETLGLPAIQKVADAMRQKYPETVKSVQNGRIVLAMPENTELYQFLSELYKIKADVEEEPSVLIDSRTGILISGGNVQISETAVTYNGTKVTIGGTSAEPGKNEGNMKLLKPSATVQDLVDAFNQIGASGSDIARILQLLYRNGNLKGKLIVQ